MRIGVPYWDVFYYLNNALYFAGMEGGGVSTFLPPLIPFLTSLLFRLGYVSVNAIFIVSGIISIIGVIGLYLLFKERFNSIQSFAGSLIFISLPIMISWAVSGGIDIPGVIFSIWTIYFMIIGLKKDSRFLYFVLPLLVLSILAKYTSGLIILPMLLYLLIIFEDVKQIKNLKKIIRVVLIEFGVLILGVLYFFIKLGATASIFNLIFAIATATSTGAGDVAYNPNLLYYLQNLLNYISIGPIQGTYQEILNPSLGIPSILSYLIGFITIIGLTFYIYKGVNSRFDRVDLTQITRTKLIKSTVIMVLVIGFILSFYYKSLIISEMLFISLLFVIYRFLCHSRSKISVNNKLALDFMFLSWFGVYLIFHGILPFKVDRYFITMTPAFVYFIILGFSEFIKLTNKIKQNVKYPNFKKCGVYLILALVLLSYSTTTFIAHTPKKAFTVDIGYSCEWLKDFDPNYKDKNIRSDYPNAATWYLRMEALGAYPRLFNTTGEFVDYLNQNNVDYYIDSTSKTHPDLEGYRIIKSWGVVVIYQKK